MSVQVRLNFGPNFKHPPKDHAFKPFCDCVHIENARLTITDLIAKVC